MGGGRILGEVLETRFPEHGGVLDINAERGGYIQDGPPDFWLTVLGIQRLDQSPIKGSRQDLLLERKNIKFGSECAECN